MTRRFAEGLWVTVAVVVFVPYSTAVVLVMAAGAAAAEIRRVRRRLGRKRGMPARHPDRAVSLSCREEQAWTAITGTAGVRGDAK